MPAPSSKQDLLKKALMNLIKVLLFFGVGFAILFFVYQSQETAWQEQCALDGVPASECSLLQKILTDFQSAHFLWLLLVVLIFVISNISRTMRWLMLVRPLGYNPRFSNGFLTIMLGYFANLGFPRIGEVVRAGAFARYERIGVEKVIGTVVVDRVADVLSMLLVMGLAFALQFKRVMIFMESLGSKEEGSSSNLLQLVLVVGAVLAVLTALLAWFFWGKIQQWSFFQKMKAIFLGFWEGIQSIRQLKQPGWFIFHSINIWFMYFLMTYVGFFAFAPTAHLGPLAGLLVFVVGALGIVIPSPGGMGTYHFLVSAVLTFFYDIPNADAFSFANILFFTVQVGGNVLLGLLALVLLPVLNRKYQPERVPHPSHDR